VISAVRDTTGCQNVEAWSIDMTDFKTVRAFADRYEQDGGGRLDLLVMNAGVNKFKYSKTVDEWETMFVLRHLRFVAS
jgi:retinol dehydrogenase-12